MIFSPLSYKLIFQDAIYALCVGFLSGFFNQVLGIFLFKGKTRIFIKDLLSSLVFTILMYSYVISFANYNTMRWYHIVCGLIGFVCFSPCFSRVANTGFLLFMATLRVPIKHINKLIIKSSKTTIKNVMNRPPKKQEISQNSSLQSSDDVLYNW